MPTAPPPGPQADPPALPVVGNHCTAPPSKEEPDDDRQLVDRVRAGDRSAYDDLVARYGDWLFQILLHLAGGDREAAAEFTQEAFVRAFERLDRFDGASRFSTWLYRLARNRAIDLLRRKRPQADGDFAAEQRGASGAPPQQDLERREAQHAVQQALASLPADQREIILLRDFDGQDYATIAAALDVPPGTVKSRLSRARAALREAVQPLLGDGWQT